MIRARLQHFLYLLLTGTVLSAVVLLLPLLSRIKPKFAKWFRMRFWPEPLDFQPDLWCHAVSLGEIKIALTIVEEQRDRPILFTTTTYSGYHFLIEKIGT